MSDKPKTYYTWNNAATHPPPYSHQFEWYEVMYQDGSEGQVYFFAGLWYGLSDWTNIVCWRNHERAIQR